MDRGDDKPMSKEQMLLRIHEFCRGEYMFGKACADCPIRHINVCDEGKGGKRMKEDRLIEAVRIIDEVMKGAKQ